MRHIHLLAGACLLTLAIGCASNRQPEYTVVPVQREVVVTHAYVDQAPQPAPVYGVGHDAQSLADRDLAAAVRNQFGRYGDLSGYLANIDITTRNGAVTLAGRVPGAAEKDMILAMVKNTPGVVAVNDLLHLSDGRLTPTGRSSGNSSAYSDSGDYYNFHVQGLTEADRTAAREILNALRDESVLASSVPRVDIYIVENEATLRGIVRTEQQRQSILAMVQNTPRITSVRNELRVQQLPR